MIEYVIFGCKTLFHDVFHIEILVSKCELLILMITLGITCQKQVWKGNEVTLEYDTVVEMNDFQIYATIWMNISNIISEKSSKRLDTA